MEKTTCNRAPGIQQKHEDSLLSEERKSVHGAVTITLEVEMQFDTTVSTLSGVVGFAFVFVLFNDTWSQ